MSVLKPRADLVSVGGKTSDVKHSFSETEVKAYVDFINSTLAEDEVLKDVLPMKENSQMFDLVSKGVVLCKLINKTVENTIDESSLNLNPKNTFEQNENHDKCIAGAKQIGCQIVNIGGTDLVEKKSHLVMAIIWQIIKINVLKNIASNPDLLKMQDGSVEDLSKLPPEVILMHWFNFHLKRAGHSRNIKNFSTDIADSENYAILLHRISPNTFTMKDVERILREKDLEKRAELLLESFDQIGCRKFVTAKDIVEGNPRLNLAFVATIFDQHPSLGPTDEDLAKEKAAGLQDQLSKLNSEYEKTKVQLESSVVEKQQQFSNLEKEYGDYKVKSESELQQTKQEAQDRYEKLEKDLAEFKSKSADENQQLEQRLTEEQNKFSALGVELENIKSRMEGELEKSRQETQSANETIASIQKELKENKEEAQKTKEEYEQSLAQKQQNIVNLEKEFGEFKNKSAEEAQKAKEEYESSMAEMKSKSEEEAKKAKEVFENSLAEMKSKSEEEAKKAKEEYENNMAEMKSKSEDEAKKAKEQYESLQAEFEAFKAKSSAEMESEKSDRQKEKEQLDSNIKALQEEIVQLKQRIEELLLRIQELQEEMDKMQKEGSETIQEMDSKILGLQAEMALLRKELESTLSQAQQDSLAALAAKEREKAEMQAKLEREKRLALDKAESEKEMELEKIKGLLSNSQREGWLFKLEGGLIKSWKKFWFVLKDNMLVWYKDKNTTMKEKPQGVVYVEACRFYKLDEKEAKRPFAFEITDGNKVSLRLASKEEEVSKQWLSDIRLAKKKKLGIITQAVNKDQDDE